MKCAIKPAGTVTRDVDASERAYVQQPLITHDVNNTAYNTRVFSISRARCCYWILLLLRISLSRDKKASYIVYIRYYNVYSRYSRLSCYRMHTFALVEPNGREPHACFRALPLADSRSCPL